MTWSALIPGLREIRGPLLAGYLWILAVWLIFGDRLPDGRSDEVFERLWEAGEAIGPLGRAAAASVIAYLIGALINGALRVVFRALLDRAKLSALQEAEASVPRHNLTKHKWIPIDEALGSPVTNWESHLHRELPRDLSLSTLVGLEETELGKARTAVKEATKHALAVSDGSARCRVVSQVNESLVIAIPRHDQDLIELTVPQFSPYRDVWLKRRLLETRLRELVPTTAIKIEQLDYEAEFRECLVLPLLLIILVVAFQASWLWATLLVIPFALLIQAIGLRRAAGRELIDALRARSGTGDLARITPVFDEYRADAERLEKALIDANWKNLPFLEEVVEEEMLASDLL